MEEFNAEEQLQKEFNLSQQQAKFVILVLSGEKPINAVRESYSFTKDNNYYKQLKELMRNPKIDNALRSMGMNLKDKFEKNAIAIIQAWEDIAFNKDTSTRDRLNALDKLAQYNPVLLTNRKKDADDSEESDIEKRLKEHFDEEVGG